MGVFFKKFTLGSMLFLSLFKSVQAGQEIYLSESPNGRYRVFVHQELYRRVGEKVFFHYPITALNLRNHHSMTVYDASVPLIQETEKGTFKIHWESFHVDWSKNSQVFFIQIEALEGDWKTLLVDLSKGQAKDATDEIKGGVLDKISLHSWACEPAKITLDHWFNNFIAVFKVTDDCGKNRDQENNKLWRMTDRVVYDTHLQKVIKGCMDCDPQKVERIAWEYYQKVSATPTPTPVPEETPSASQ